MTSIWSIGFSKVTSLEQYKEKTRLIHSCRRYMYCTCYNQDVNIYRSTHPFKEILYRYFIKENNKIRSLSVNLKAINKISHKRDSSHFTVRCISAAPYLTFLERHTRIPGPTTV